MTVIIVDVFFPLDMALDAHTHTVSGSHAGYPIS